VRTYFGLVSVMFFAGAFWLVARGWLLVANGITVRGRVVTHEKRSAEDSGYYVPVVMFIDRHGSQHRFTATAGWPRPRPAVGTAVTVRYLPQSPDRAVIVSFLHMWAAPLAMLVLGAGALLGYLQS
jgi:hypothetical protein